jgi:ADP-heptose:LPS heptosyltransferase
MGRSPVQGRSPEPSRGVSPRCLVIHPGALGDVLLAVPALAHLSGLGFETTLAVDGRLAALFAASGLVHEARDLESLALHRLFVAPAESKALGSGDAYDAVVSWFGAGDATFRESLAATARTVVVARAAPPPGTGRHVARHLLETLAALGPLPADWPDARFGAAASDQAAVTAWLGDRGIEPAAAIVLQPGAGSASKIWPGFAELARRLRGAGTPVVALAGPADRVAAEALLSDGAMDGEHLARDWPLPRVAALLSLARAAVGNDSGPTHLAAVVGCPTVAVFGPSDPAVWAPIGRHVRVVAGRRGGATWSGVDVERVEAALRELPAGRAARRAGSSPVPVAAAGHAWR